MQDYNRLVEAWRRSGPGSYCAEVKYEGSFVRPSQAPVLEAPIRASLPAFTGRAQGAADVATSRLAPDPSPGLEYTGPYRSH